MSGQPQLFTNQESPTVREPALREPGVPAPALRNSASGLEATPNIPDDATNITHRSTGTPTPIWLQRLSLFVLVLFCVYLGVLVMVLPWWTRIWDHNALMDAHPPLAAFLRNGAVRGVISGLGLLDIWIGISEAVHYRDYRG
jgi:hypothetical protein